MDMQHQTLSSQELQEHETVNQAKPYESETVHRGIGETERKARRKI